MKLKKILFITAFYPSTKADSAGVKDTAFLYEDLCKLFDVTLVCFYDINDKSTISEKPNQHLFRNRTFEHKFWYLIKTFLSFFSSLSSISLMSFSIRMKRRIAKLSIMNNFDYVFIEFSQMFQYARDLKAKNLIVMDESDVAFERRKRYIENNVKGLLKSLLIYDNKKLMNEELKYLENADLVLTRTSRDFEVLVKNGLSADKRNHILLPWVDFGEINFNVISDEKKINILFFGALWRPVNEEAIIYFIEQIFPILESKINLQFVIAGSKPSSKIKEYSSNKIIITGFVENISDLYSRTHITIAPLLSGSGIKGKVIQSLGFGVPVVATPVGAEGIDLGIDDGLIVCNQEIEFANNIMGYGFDEDYRKKIFKQKTKIQGKYNWDKNFNSLIQRLQ